jgi:predicted site-specific integrase-resolvase
MSAFDDAPYAQQYSLKEAAAIIGVSVDTLARYAKDNKIKVTMLPSARGTRSFPRVSKLAIEAFIQSGYPLRARPSSLAN